MQTRVHRILRTACPLIVLPLIVAGVASQAPGGGETLHNHVINQSSNPLLAGLRFRSIGPASMGGRIDAIAVSESDPNIIYLGYATGGVFKSEDNATTFEPVFETYPSASIGDIAIHPA